MSGQLAVLTGLVIAFWIGRFLGEDGLSGLALVRPVMLCVFWFFGSVAFGATFLVARSVGARDGRGLTIMTSGAGLIIVLWLATVLVVLPNARAISGHIGAGASSSVADYVVPWVVVTLPAAALCELLMGVGAAARQTRLTLLRSVVDLALVASVTPVLLATTSAGLGAGALAHALASAIVAVALWRTLVRRGRDWQLGPPAGARELATPRRWLELLNVGLPVQMARVVSFAAQAMMIRELAGSGKAAVGGVGVAAILMMVGAQLTMGFAQAAGIQIGHGIGARDGAAARGSFRTAAIVVCQVAAVATLALVLAAGWLVQIFTSDAAMAADGARALRIMSTGLLAVGLGQLLIATYGAMASSKRAGLLGMAADAAAVVFASAADVGGPLDTVAIAFVVGPALRCVLLAALLPRVFLRPTAAMGAGKDAAHAS